MSDNVIQFPVSQQKQLMNHLMIRGDHLDPSTRISLVQCIHDKQIESIEELETLLFVMEI